MKAEYTYTQLVPPPLPKGEGKSTKFKNIYDKSSELPLYLISKACNDFKKYSKYDV